MDLKEAREKGKLSHFIKLRAKTHPKAGLRSLLGAGCLGAGDIKRSAGSVTSDTTRLNPFAHASLIACKFANKGNFYYKRFLANARPDDLLR
jgi:hypothetical protein